MQSNLFIFPKTDFNSSHHDYDHILVLICLSFSWHFGREIGTKFYFVFRVYFKFIRKTNQYINFKRWHDFKLKLRNKTIKAIVNQNDNKIEQIDELSRGKFLSVGKTFSSEFIYKALKMVDMLSYDWLLAPIKLNSIIHSKFKNNLKVQ